MMANVPHVISGLGLRKFHADGFLLTRVYKIIIPLVPRIHLRNFLGAADGSLRVRTSTASVSPQQYRNKVRYAMYV